MVGQFRPCLEQVCQIVGIELVPFIALVGELRLRGQQIGAAAADAPVAGIYFVPFKAYLIFYRVNETALEIGRILPVKSDYIKTLFGIGSMQFDDMR